MDQKKDERKLRKKKKGKGRKTRLSREELRVGKAKD
jgi:hypothetical protein